ncbi:MAG: Hsp20/alpha crystallin family protein [Desulfuromonadales bacterium]|nr:MAG: Hsp20/alpha crystallin family protein [Desulfuromonadales bacterium]
MAAKQSKKDESGAVEPVEPRRDLTTYEGVERWFEDFFHQPFFASPWVPRVRFPDMVGDFYPSVDIFEDGTDLVVKAEIPGIRKEDIDVRITGESVTIAGMKRSEEKVEKKDYYRLERSFGTFSRTLRIPVEVQSDKAKASFRDGILEVRIPKAQEAKAKSKKIAVE